MNRLNRHGGCWLAISLLVLTGCVAIQPFPFVSRAGDTITLVVGSLDGASRENITVNYYSDSDPVTPIDMTASVRSVIRIYADKTSAAYWDTTSGPSGFETMNFMASVTAKHAPWQTVVVLDLPLTTPGGPGHFEITFGAGVRYPLSTAKVDDVQIAFEVLTDNVGVPLTGESNDFLYRTESYNQNVNTGNLVSLEPLKQAVVRNIPSQSSGAYPAAAASYELSIPVVDTSLVDVSDQVTNDKFAVVLDDIPDYLRNQVNLNWSRQGSAFKVVVTALSGVQDFRNIRYAILLTDSSLTSVNGWQLGAPSILEVNYYDVDGNDVTSAIAPPSIKLQ
jgi:hypothetical protein